MNNIYKYLLALALAIGLSTNAFAQDYVTLEEGVPYDFMASAEVARC